MKLLKFLSIIVGSILGIVGLIFVFVVLPFSLFGFDDVFYGITMALTTILMPIYLIYNIYGIVRDIDDYFDNHRMVAYFIVFLVYLILVLIPFTVIPTQILFNGISILMFFWLYVFVMPVFTGLAIAILVILIIIAYSFITFIKDCLIDLWKKL